MKNKSKKYQKKHVPFDKTIAMMLHEKGVVKLNTVEKWEEQGFIPEHYFVPSNCILIGKQTLTSLREQKGLSQQEFVKLFNSTYSVEVTTVSVSHWETGKFKPSKMYKNLLYKFFEVKE
jgi:DNA-binding XRE family transcriptional regulator